MQTAAKNKIPASLLLAIAAAAAVNIAALFLLTFTHGTFSLFGSNDDTIPINEFILSSPNKPDIQEFDPSLLTIEPTARPFVVENKLPTDMFDALQPEEQKLNALLDTEEGGTEMDLKQKRSGGGGGAEADALDLGHAQTDDKVWAKMKWKSDRNATQAAAGADNGRGESIPGTLKKPGAGSGLGNGNGSGALGSQGSGTGSGAGTNGANTGTGLGTAPPLVISRKPAIISMNRGEYPYAARLEHREGTVQLYVEVLPSGDVGQVEVKSSSGHSDLDQAALQTAKTWRFTGALQEGKPITYHYTIPYRFQLTN